MLSEEELAEIKARADMLCVEPWFTNHGDLRAFADTILVKDVPRLLAALEEAREVLKHYASEETYKGMCKAQGQWEILTREARAALGKTT